MGRVTCATEILSLRPCAVCESRSLFSSSVSPIRTSQCMKNGCEKLNFIPIVYDRIQHEIRTDV